MQTKTKYDGIEKYISSQTYIFFRNFYDGDGSDSFWEKVIETGSDLCKEFDSHPMAIAFVGEYIRQIEHRVCGVKRNGRSYEQWEKTLEAYKNKYNIKEA